MDEKKKEGISDEILIQIKNELGALRYGSLTVIVQDGRVVQIEKNEKIRCR